MEVLLERAGLSASDVEPSVVRQRDLTKNHDDPSIALMKEVARRVGFAQRQGVGAIRHLDCKCPGLQPLVFTKRIKLRKVSSEDNAGNTVKRWSVDGSAHHCAAAAIASKGDAKCLPSCSSRSDCVSAEDDAGNTAKRQSVDGISHCRATAAIASEGDAERLPSGRSGSDCVGAGDDSVDNAMHRSIDGIDRHHVPCLGRARANKPEDNLASLRQWVYRLEEEQDKANERLMDVTDSSVCTAVESKEEACWGPLDEYGGGDNAALPPLVRGCGRVTAVSTTACDDEDATSSI